MKSLSRQISLAVLAGTMALAAHAQEFKAGYVNQERLFREAATAKTAQAKLEQEFSKREKELLEAENSFTAAVTKYKREVPTLPESQRVARERQLADQESTFVRKRREFQEDLNARRNEELSQLVERANKVIKTIAETEKFDLIVQEVVYINPKHDITDKVIKALNAAK